MKPEKRCNTESRHFCLKSEVSTDTSSSCFCSNDITGVVGDHQTFLSLIWYNLPCHGLGWLELNTLFSKDILSNIFSRKNAVPTNLESSSSDSNTKTPKRGSLTLRVISFKRKQQGRVSRNFWFQAKTAGLSFRSSDDFHEVKLCYSKRTTNIKPYFSSKGQLRRKTQNALAKRGWCRRKCSLPFSRLHYIVEVIMFS